MNTSKLLGALLVLCLSNGDAIAKDKNKDGSPLEYCGKNSSAPFGNESMHWDCSGIVVKTISDLETMVKQTHSIPDTLKGTENKVYESTDPHFSAWIFLDTKKAIRFRALYEDDQWKGVGVTTFCSDSVESCSRLEAFAASKIPDPLVFSLGPPPPGE